jgi:MOSC domain-containing protein YiiM
MAPRLVSVNIGFPREITWRGKTIRTGIWKSRVVGRVIVRKLNIDGDGQGDLAGHGGVNRAVMVYQLDSYPYWERQLSRNDFSYGQFGENFTVEACLTLKSVLATVTASAPHYSRYRSRGLRVIASVSAWTNRKWQR